MRFVLSELAQQDVDAILDWSLEKFGEQALTRDAWWLQVALTKIGGNPELPNSREFCDDLRLYHLRYSKKDAEVDGGIVQRPRHFITYRIESDRVLIIRVLHDSMDFRRHLGT